LDDYVAAPDPNYRYTLRRTITDTDYKAYVLELTSQKWRTLAEVDRNLWKHWLIVVKPNTVVSDTAMLIIDGGNNGGTVPRTVDEELVGIAVATETVVAQVKMVPNQPLRFADETSSRVEDALIAYTWDKFLRTGDVTWPAQLPMTKSVVRAMDAVQAFCAGLAVNPVTINHFVVGGASKRGWTTWLTAAVDPRVVAIAPLVIDVLNVEKSFEHHFNSYGFWTPAVHDYVEMGIMDWMGTPELHALMAIVDPYVYRDRFTMPKFIVNATGDQFFHPESSQFYWDDLPGPKYLRYVPNTDHSMTGMEVDVAGSLLMYYLALLNGTPLPQFSWTLEPDGSIRVQTVDPPVAVRLWQATNPTARDFRLETIGAAWTNRFLLDKGGGLYIGRVTQPDQGWTAFFVELEFDSGSLFPHKFTTQVRVIPEPARLNLTVVNSSWGTVQVEPNLPKYYDPNTTVTLTAMPIEGKVFRYWELYDPNHPDDDNYVVIDANNPLRIVMNDNREVTAAFACGNSALTVLVTPVLLGMILMWGFSRLHRAASR